MKKTLENLHKITTPQGKSIEDWDKQDLIDIVDDHKSFLQKTPHQDRDQLQQKLVNLALSYICEIKMMTIISLPTYD